MSLLEVRGVTLRFGGNHRPRPGLVLGGTGRGVRHRRPERGPASRRSSTSSPGSATRRRARCASRERTSSSAPPRQSRRSASRAPFRTSSCSSSRRCSRTSSSGGTCAGGPPSRRRSSSPLGVRREEIAHRAPPSSGSSTSSTSSRTGSSGSRACPTASASWWRSGRALAIEPKLLLMDEPASGLSPEETRDMRFRIDDIRRRMGITVVMVEHDMGLVTAGVGPGAGARRRTGGHPRNPRRGQVAPEGHRGIPRRGRGGDGMSGALLEIRNLETWYGPDHGHPRGEPSRCRRAASSPSSAPTERGRPPCSRPSPGSWTPTRARVLLAGEPIEGGEPDGIVRKGVVHVPEGREVFPLLDVAENLAMGAYTRRDDEVGEDREMVFGLLPGPEGTASPARRHAFGRGAADARHRARAHGPAEDHAPRRAVARPLSHPRPRHLRPSSTV